MDISFEMIREAGIRMPNPIGSTLGIVGGLILGQAAVSAKIVSPIMIIIIAITGIGSFATSDYSLSWGYRILRAAPTRTPRSFKQLHTSFLLPQD